MMNTAYIGKQLYAGGWFDYNSQVFSDSHNLNEEIKRINPFGYWKIEMTGLGYLTGTKYFYAKDAISLLSEIFLEDYNRFSAWNYRRGLLIKTYNEDGKTLHTFKVIPISERTYNLSKR